MFAKLFACKGEEWRCKNNFHTSSTMTAPVQVAVLPKAQVYGRSLGLLVRIPPGSWMSIFCECYVVMWRSLRQTEHSSRGFLPIVVCLCEIVKPR